MKALIYQVKVGPDPPKFYDICIDSVARYCKKYGIDHVVQREPILKIRPLNSQRSESAVERLGYLPIYEKENAFNYLDEYDKIAVIDSDIYVRDNAPNIFDRIDSEAFGGVLECKMPLTPKYLNKIRHYSRGQYQPLTDVQWIDDISDGIPFYNMGLMVLTQYLKPFLNGQTPEEFIRRPEFERLVNGEGKWRWSTDQTLLNYWIKRDRIPTKDLDWKWNALFKGVRDQYLHDAYFIHFFLSANLPKKGEEIPEIIKNLDNAKKIKGHY